MSRLKLCVSVWVAVSGCGGGRASCNMLAAMSRGPTPSSSMQFRQSIWTLRLVCESVFLQLS